VDEFTGRHLTAWIAGAVHPEDQQKVGVGIRRFVKQHPFVIERGDSWTEIRKLAEREGYIR
jgi:hypothetical protein